MSLIINILLFLLIFGYTGYMIYRYTQKTKAGKCNSCDVNQSCGCETNIEHKIR